MRRLFQYLKKPAGGDARPQPAPGADSCLVGFDFDASAERIISTVLKWAVAHRASGIDFCPSRKGVCVSIRIGREVAEVSVPGLIAPQLRRALRRMAGLDLPDTDENQHALAWILLDNRPVHLQVSALSRNQGNVVQVTLLH